jgi:lipoxygenase homology domain-containing protein 1
VYFPADRWIEGTNAATLTPGAAAIQYIVDVTTTDRAQAGTDANVFITIIGDKGSTPELRLNGAISGNAFERGQTDRAIISGPDVGNVTGIRIRHDNMYASPAWHLASVRVIRDHVRGQSWDFHHGEWLESPRPEVSLSPGGARVDIAVTVKTGTESGAGTDANVFIRIYGSNGSTGDLRLNGLISGNAFENGDSDLVTLRNQTDIGEITGVDVWHDNMYAGAAWFLESISISIPGRASKTYSFREWLEGSSNRKERR